MFFKNAKVEVEIPSKVQNAKNVWMKAKQKKIYTEHSVMTSASFLHYQFVCFPVNKYEKEIALTERPISAWT